MTEKKIITREIENFLSSLEFRNKLEFIHKNYFNLKQEALIRNSILEHLNAFFEKDPEPKFKAIAEYRHNNKRIDLSIFRKNDELLGEKGPFLTMELKFQISGDEKSISYKKIIEDDFERRNSDIFLLTVADWKKRDKVNFHKPWNLKDTLSHNLSNNPSWHNTIKNVMLEFDSSLLTVMDSIEISEPYPTEYHFLILKRKESVLA